MKTLIVSALALATVATSASALTRADFEAQAERVGSNYAVSVEVSDLSTAELQKIVGAAHNGDSAAEIRGFIKSVTN